MKREPNTTSARSSIIGVTSDGRSRGSYSISASWITTMSPVACAMPVATADARCTAAVLDGAPNIDNVVNKEIYA